MTIIDYKGDLEIIIKYGGQILCEAKKENVQGDALQHNIDLLNIQMISGIDKIMRDMKKGVLGK